MAGTPPGEAVGVDSHLGDIIDRVPGDRVIVAWHPGQPEWAVIPCLQPSPPHWWTLTLRGLVAVLFGLAAFLWPALTALVFLFGFFTLLDGIFDLVEAVRVRKRYDQWRAFLL